jgi:hypothetical protein
MKRSLVLLCLASFALALPAMAAKRKAVIDQVDGQGYGMAGCGLGSIIFGEKTGPIQILAATTNDIYGNQTFGITSGTSNCTDSSNGNTAELFITANREALEKDMARGSGETLSGLSTVMGCSNTQALGTKLQRNYGTIFPSKAVSTDQVIDSIKGAVKTDSELSAECSKV